MSREREMRGLSGWAMLLLLSAGLFVAGYLIVQSAIDGSPWGILVWTLVLVLDGASLAGLTVVNPNEARVVTLFGVYHGSIKTPGFWWVNPLTIRRRLSLRVRNFESGKLKVNDLDGNPIEIASVVVWRVVDTAEAMFEVENFENYVKVQTESAIRNLASRYPYDSHDDEKVSLRGSTASVAGDLKREIQDRLAKAGVEVIEARISHLAYAPEIAAVMLRRQQAAAIIAARTRIVEGAVGMVDMALERLAKSSHVQLDEERKAAMVSNLLVVLCSDREAQPVVNTGTLYQ